MSKATLTFLDASNETSPVSVTSTVLTAANFDAQVSAFTAFRSAVEALSLGTAQKWALAQSTDGSETLPTNPYAQRELKWLVTYTGNTSGKKFQIEIPAPDLTDNRVPGTDIADPTSADWVAFISAFEAFAKSPDNPTEAVTFVGARMVGRNI